MNKTRVMVVDDHPIVREGLTHLIERDAEFEVVSQCGSLVQVLDEVQMARPDVILLDIQMEVSTFSVAKKIRSLLPDTKVLFLTAFFTSENVAQAERFGGLGIVSKLQAGDELITALKTVATGATYFRNVPVGAVAVASTTLNQKIPVDHPLSPREVDILCCVARAMTAKQIAKTLSISVKTVDRHKANIMDKLSMKSQIEMTRYAIRNRFVDV